MNDKSAFSIWLLSRKYAFNLSNLLHLWDSIILVDIYVSQAEDWLGKILTSTAKKIILS